MYSKSDVIVRNLSAKIANNTLEINNTNQKCDKGTFNIAFRKRFSDLVSEHCEVMPKASTEVGLATKMVAKTLTSLINDAWKSCKKNFSDSKQSVEINDLVLARMETYSAWPGKLSSFAKNNKRATVHFFRTNNSGSVDVCEIVQFEQCYDAIRLLLLRKVGPFHKAKREIEKFLEVLDNVSS